MRWQELFADLQAQADHADDLEFDAEVAERTRTERSRIRLAERLRAHVGRPLTVELAGGGVVSGTLDATGEGWLLFTDCPGEAVVLTAAVGAARGLGPDAVPDDAAGAVARRLGVAHVLRGLARDRATVAVELLGGRTLTVLLDAAGADAVDVVDVPPGESRPQAGAVRRTLPFAAVAVLRRR
jgi:hypothetical protein